MTAGTLPEGSLDAEPVDPGRATTFPASAGDTTYAERWYEERKRDLIAAVLPRRYYQLAVEPGCGSGAITEALAARSNRVLAWDIDIEMVRACRDQVGRLDNVEVRQGVMPQDWPTDVADLIVLSEIGYHFAPDELDDLISRAITGLAHGGTLVAAHRRDSGPLHRLSGDDVHTHLFGRAGLVRTGGYADDELRIDVFESLPLKT